MRPGSASRGADRLAAAASPRVTRATTTSATRAVCRPVISSQVARFIVVLLPTLGLLRCVFGRLDRPLGEGSTAPSAHSRRQGTPPTGFRQCGRYRIEANAPTTVRTPELASTTPRLAPLPSSGRVVPTVASTAAICAGATGVANVQCGTHRPGE